jgi:hypothetical protein
MDDRTNFFVGWGTLALINSGGIMNQHLRERFHSRSDRPDAAKPTKGRIRQTEGRICRGWDESAARALQEVRRPVGASRLRVRAD